MVASASVLCAPHGLVPERPQPVTQLGSGKADDAQGGERMRWLPVAGAP